MHADCSVYRGRRGRLDRILRSRPTPVPRRLDSRRQIAGLHLHRRAAVIAGSGLACGSCSSCASSTRSPAAALLAARAGGIGPGRARVLLFRGRCQPHRRVRAWSSAPRRTAAEIGKRLQVRHELRLLRARDQQPSSATSRRRSPPDQTFAGLSATPPSSSVRRATVRGIPWG